MSREYGVEPKREDYANDWAFGIATTRYQNELPHLLPFKVVAFLQNMWFKDPERTKQVFEKHPDKREWLIASFLFMGCQTGKRIKKAFSDDIREQIVWEEVSREIGGKASSCFEPDMVHIRDVLCRHRPGIVITFGKVAENAIRKVRDESYDRDHPWDVIIAPHPAARHPTVMDELHKAMAKLRWCADNFKKS